MKREMSDTDSEHDLLDDGCTSPLHHSGMDRKKRRGIIEKRRRDRINHSLTELKRLVPAAYEKQGSAKLEKAEILQMTVDHLKVLQQQKGFGYPDPSTIAMDYRSLGFRECAGEVARYLMSVEGLDNHDPLRLRLLSHLQCFSHQRESDMAKTRMVAAAVVNGGQGGAVPPPTGAQVSNTWVAAAATGGSTPGANAAQTGYSTATSTTPTFINEPITHSTQPQQIQVASNQVQFSSVPLNATVHPQQQAQQHISHSGQQQQVMSHPPAGCSPTFMNTGTNSPGVSTPSMAHHNIPQQTSFPQMVQVSTPMHYNTNGLMAHHGGNTKPYRPWGTELGAY